MEFGKKLIANIIDLFSSDHGVLARTHCNFPEAQLNNTFEILNTRFFNSEPRSYISVMTTVLSEGPENVTVKAFILYFRSAMLR